MTIGLTKCLYVVAKCYVDDSNQILFILVSMHLIFVCSLRNPLNIIIPSTVFILECCIVQL